MQCPKCGYVRKPTDASPDSECPSCGIIYAKFNPATSTSARIPATLRPNHSAPVTQAGSVASKRISIPIWVISAIAGLIIGYFIGREHIKYELRQSLQAAADGISKGIGATFESPVATPKPAPAKAPKPSEPQPISVTLLKKGFHEASNHNGDFESDILLTVQFSNLTDKDIRAFDGALVFTDLLDNVIMRTRISISDPISVGQSIEWKGAQEYNQFKDAHQRLRNQEQSDLKISFNPHKVLYADGTTKEFGGE